MARVGSSSPVMSVACTTGLAVIVCMAVLCAGEPETTCTFPSVEQGQTATFTCEFGVNMQDEGQRSDVILKKQVPGKDYKEDLVDCYWPKEKGEYLCKVKNPRVYFNNEVTDRIKVILTNVTKEDEGTYYCEVTQRKLSVCKFTLKAKEVTTPRPLPLEPTTPKPTPCPKSWKGEAIAFIILFFLLLLAVVVYVLYIKCWSKGEKPKEGVKSAEEAENQPLVNVHDTSKEKKPEDVQKEGEDQELLKSSATQEADDKPPKATVQVVNEGEKEVGGGEPATEVRTDQGDVDLKKQDVDQDVNVGT